jgi:hypothetical protein
MRDRYPPLVKCADMVWPNAPKPPRCVWPGRVSVDELFAVEWLDVSLL